MKFKFSWLLSVVLLVCASAFAQAQAVSRASGPLLRNADVLRMVAQGMKPGEIVAKIVTSNCAFDVFPPVIEDLKRRGVPDTVLLAMKMVPYGPPAMAVAGPPKTTPAPERSAVMIPAGTVIGIEAAKAFSSAKLEKGNAITFLVSRRIMVKGVMVIDRGAVANARVIKSKPAGSWGRGGTLEFALEDVEAVDGTRVPIRLSSAVKGSNHTTAVTVAAIVTGAVVFPYASPVGLVWALKKGDNAVLEQGTKLTAVVRNSQEIAGLVVDKKKLIYHPVNTASLKSRPAAQGLKSSFNKSFRATSIRR